MLCLEDEGRSILVDCGGDAYQRVMMAGLDPTAIDGLIITHEHPDHVAGFVLLIMRMWQDGRTDSLPVFGISSALRRAQRLMEAFETERWDLPPIEWNEVPLEEHAVVMETETWRITASPGVHSAPVTGLHFHHKPSDFSTCYSCDTEPCGSISRLAEGCHLLIHEATGAGTGHSSAEQAIGVAAEAGCPQLVLVHLPRGLTPEHIARMDRKGVEVIVGEELDRLEF